jgi:hypothetical protein
MNDEIINYKADGVSRAQRVFLGRAQICGQNNRQALEEQ